MKSHQINRIRPGHSLYVVEQGCRSEYERKDGATIAEIGKEIVFDPSILDTYRYDGWQSVHHDLLVVCAAVEFADRRYARSNIQWSRRFLITVPVLELDVWQRPKVLAYLGDTLRHLTGDDWHFTFVEAEKSALINHRQRSLDFGDIKQFAIAYSDGLDSRYVSEIYESLLQNVQPPMSKRLC